MKFSKSFFVRLFWFVVGGVLSIGVNAGLFRLFQSGFGWNRFAAYALSLAIINVLLFLWNYVVGFKTHRHWSDAAWRQGVCLGAANALNYALVMGLLGWFPDWPRIFPGLISWIIPVSVAALPHWPEVVIAVVQVLIALFKFVLYHYWVYAEQAPVIATVDADGVS